MAITSQDASVRPARYVDWGAILAGGVFAAAVGLTFLAFGTGIGFSFASPIRGEGFHRFAFIASTGLWLILTQVASNAGGGYLAGRLRGRAAPSRDAESELRDAAHGLAVWALAALISAAIAAFAAGGATKLGGAATSTTREGDVFRYTADVMMRADRPVGAAVERELAIQEAARILAVDAARREVPSQDRQQLARLVVLHTGLPSAEASTRVDQVLAQAKDEAERTARAARQAGVLLAFITAVALLLGALAAWWAAGMGGRHRDENQYHRFFRWPTAYTP